MFSISSKTHCDQISLILLHYRDEAVQDLKIIENMSGGGGASSTHAHNRHSGAQAGLTIVLLLSVMSIKCREPVHEKSWESEMWNAITVTDYST